MLSIFPEIADYGIDIVDVGCSGGLDPKWDGLAEVLNYVGFDPDREECDRLSAVPGPYRRARYIPSAVTGHVGEVVIHLTESPHCSSVLEPRYEWLRRFSCHHLFRRVGQVSVDCVTLDRLAETEALRADILKLDTQGLELPILKCAEAVLRDAFCVETETGFVENYHGETVASDVDGFMRQHGFLIFDISIHRVGRANPLAERSRRQPLWCQTLWLRDYLAAESWGIDVPVPGREQAVKALHICKCLGFSDYGFELAGYFHAKGLLSDREMALLSEHRSWINEMEERRGVVESLFCLLPLRVRRALHRSLGTAVNRPHLLKTLLRKHRIRR